MCEGLNLVLLLCLVNLQKRFDTFFHLQLRGSVRKTNRKKTPGAIKKEFQESILEVSEEENANLNEAVENMKSLNEGISLIQNNKNLLKGAKKKIININGNQGDLLKRYKEEDKFFDCVGLSKSNIYFKMRLFKFLCIFPVLKNSTLTPSYFKSNLKQTKKVCKANVDIFDK